MLHKLNQLKKQFGSLLGYSAGIMLMYLSAITSGAAFAIIGIILLVNTFVSSINANAQQKVSFHDEQFYSRFTSKDSVENAYEKGFTPFKADKEIIEEINFTDIPTPKS